MFCAKQNNFKQNLPLRKKSKSKKAQINELLCKVRFRTRLNFGTKVNPAQKRLKLHKKSPSWYDDGEIPSQAFILKERAGVFEEGLSVSNNVANALLVFQKTKAVVSLHVGRIRDLNEALAPLVLSVLPDNEVDSETGNKIHAEIRGMPPPDSIENTLIAERVATALIELIQNRPLAWERPHP